MLKLAIVAPCYNEEDVLEDSTARLSDLMKSLIAAGKISGDSFIFYVNDGSKDGTWDLVVRLHDLNPFVKGLCLAHNVGHQKAIMAGMMEARGKCDALVTLDADLQDDINCIPQMLDEYEKGFDVVYGVKVERKADSVLKRWSAECFYKMMAKLGAETVYNHADFRFMSRRVLDALSGFPEKNLYLRALLPRIGFPSSTVADKIGERKAGVSKYSVGKMFGLALEGITSFTEKPLYYVVFAGGIFIAISIIMLVYVLVSLFSGHVAPGWTSLMLSLWFIGGVILIAVGITGIYIGKVYSEVKARPLYVVQEYLD